MAISNKDLFELFKQDKVYMKDIPNPTEEMVWWAIKNDKYVGTCNLTDDMIIEMIKRGNIGFDFNRLDTINVSETIWIDYINNNKILNSLCGIDELSKYLISSAYMSENIAMAFCLRIPLLYDKPEIAKFIPDSRKQEISDVFFNGLREGDHWYFELPAELPISDEQWQWLLDNGKITYVSNGVEVYIRNRKDVPDFVRQSVLKKMTRMDDWGKFTADDLIVWITAHRDELDTDYGCKDTIKYYLKCDEMEKVLSECGWFIKYLKNQPFNLCKAAIDCDPSNIQYVKKPSKKLIEYTLSIDKSVAKYVEDKTEEALSKKYPADKYLIKIVQDLCDEGELVRVCVIKGKDMEKFMSTTTSLSFGNLEDDTEYTIDNIASYKPITDEELKVLRKFDLTDIKSGYFRNIGYGDFNYVK